MTVGERMLSVLVIDGRRGGGVRTVKVNGGAGGSNVFGVFAHNKQVTNALCTGCYYFPIVKPSLFSVRFSLFSFRAENTPYVSGRKSNVFYVERRESERTCGDS